MSEKPVPYGTTPLLFPTGVPTGPYTYRLGCVFDKNDSCVLIVGADWANEWSGYVAAALNLAEFVVAENDREAAKKAAEPIPAPELEALVSAAVARIDELIITEGCAVCGADRHIRPAGVTKPFYCADHVDEAVS